MLCPACGSEVNQTISGNVCESCNLGFAEGTLEDEFYRKYIPLVKPEPADDEAWILELYERWESVS